MFPESLFHGDMKVSDAGRERYAKYLARHGWKLTSPASRVVDVAFAMHGTFSAEDMLATLSGEISRPTVYRTLARLVDAEVLRRVEFNNQPVLVLAVQAD